MSMISWTTLAVAVLALAGAPAAAQEPSIEMQAEIPFAFYVGGERMPPGTYEVETFPDSSSSPILSVERAEPAEGQQHFVSVGTIPVGPTDPSERPRLVFEKVGDVNLLVKVVPEDGTVRRIQR
jgi:hypothetical protein